MNIYYPVSIFLVIPLLLFTSCNTKIEYLPETLYGLQQVEKINGEKAKNFVNRLHFSNVTDTENKIGFYEGKPGKATLYLTIYSDETKARLDEEKMTNKISPSNSVFSPVMYRTIKGKVVGYTFGMGQKHFIFSHDNILFWISAENDWADKFLNYYFEYVLSI